MLIYYKLVKKYSRTGELGFNKVQHYFILKNTCLFYKNFGTKSYLQSKLSFKPTTCGINNNSYFSAFE